MFKNEIELFRAIWDSKEHVCEVCRKDIHYPSPSNFAHILAKGGYNNLRFSKDNIALLCIECHDEYDKGDRSKDMFKNLVKRGEDLTRLYYKVNYNKKFD